MSLNTSCWREEQWGKATAFVPGLCGFPGRNLVGHYGVQDAAGPGRSVVLVSGSPGSAEKNVAPGKNKKQKTPYQ